MDTFAMSHVKVQQQQLEAEFDAATELLLCAREQLSVKKWLAMECAVSAAFFLQKASGTLEFACLSRFFYLTNQIQQDPS